MGLDESEWHAKAAANLLEARRKNGRLGIKKSRSGCISCKERRVKCDEERPECRRCTLAGRRCEGYSVSTPSSRTSSSPPIQQSPSLVLHIKDSQRRTYDFFLSCAGPRISGPWDRDFWGGYVLQLAHMEPLVTDCLLAISTLYEHPQFMASFRRNPFRRSALAERDAESQEVAHPNVPPPPDEFHASALQRYNSAIRQLKERVEQGVATPSLVLTTCALFCTIEMIRDNIFAALALIKHGAGMLEHYKFTETDQQQTGLLRVVRLMFSRIGVTAATIGYPLPEGDLPKLASTGQVSTFESLTDARDTLFAIMSGSHAFFQDTAAWKNSFISSNGCSPHSSAETADAENSTVIETMYGTAYRWTNPDEVPARQNITNPLPSAIATLDDPGEAAATFGASAKASRVDTPLRQGSPTSQSDTNLSEILCSLQSVRTCIVDRLDEWLRTFQATYERTHDPDTETLSCLLMYYHASYVWACTRLNIANMIFDQHTFHFEQIVHHADIWLSAQSDGMATFTFETGAVAPLYLTATCCRIPSLRRQALDLMSKAPRKECFHGAESTAEIASRVIAIEEEGLGHTVPDCSGRCATGTINDEILPPENQRIHYLELKKNTVMQRHEMTVTRYNIVDGLFMPNTETFPI